LTGAGPSLILGGDMVEIINPYGDEAPLPKLRPIDIVPVEVEGRQMFLMRDPEQICPAPVAVSADVVFVATMLDGENKRSDISQAFAKVFNGMLIDPADLTRIVSSLDEALLLETDRYRERVDELTAEFHDSRVRLSTCAGGVYEADPEDLGRELSSLFTAEGGPGEPSFGTADFEAVGAIAPHIDLERGGREYANVYHALAAAEPPETVVILGTAHRGGEGVLAMTRKGFVTPLGEMACDLEMIDRVAGQLDWDPFAEEILHRNEHTIEIQTVFLQHLWPDAGIRIVPVLCGSLAGCVLQGTPPGDLETFGGMIAALADAVRSSERRVLVLASADLAHVGAQFGDEVPITERLLGKLEDEDVKMLGPVKDLDAEAFFDFIAAEEDRRKICGLPPIYVLLKVLGQLGGDIAGRLTGYCQAHTTEIASVVTFAGMLFTRGGKSSPS